MKKKIFMMTLAACLIVLSIVGTSLAYFTDIDTGREVFTAGNVDIDLNHVKPTTGNLYPGEEYTAANATISNVGSEDAYIGAIVKFALPKTAAPNTILTLFNGINATGKTVKYTATEGVASTEYTVYVVFTDVLTTTATPATATATIFNKMTIPDAWGAVELSSFTEVNYTAYAVQKAGFDDAETALTTAFNTDDAWNPYTGATSFTP